MEALRAMAIFGLINILFVHSLRAKEPPMNLFLYYAYINKESLRAKESPKNLFLYYACTNKESLRATEPPMNLFLYYACIYKESLRAKEPPLKLAETRLDMRTHRKLTKSNKKLKSWNFR